jgi:hypothetical protein
MAELTGKGGANQIFLNDGRGLKIEEKGLTSEKTPPSEPGSM